MCRRSARSSRQWERQCTDSKVQGVVGSKDEDSTQRNAQNTKEISILHICKERTVRKINLYP